MKRILVPTDFSEAAHNAIAYAAKLAQLTGSELVLLNAQSLFDITPQEVIEGKHKTIQKVELQLEAQCREVTKAFKISCYGDVQPSLSSLTGIITHKGSGTDLIVMGTNGPDDLFQFFTGSNTYNVIRKTSVPVLLIPEGCGYGSLRRIVYAFNYLGEHILPLSQVSTLVKSLQCELKILQVTQENHNEEKESRLRQMQLKLLAVYPDLKLSFDLEKSSDTALSIHRYVLKKNADMLALCTQHYNFLENLFHKSVIKTISGIAEYPVFVFHK